MESSRNYRTDAELILVHCGIQENSKAVNDKMHSPEFEGGRHRRSVVSPPFENIPSLGAIWAAMAIRNG